MRASIRGTSPCARVWVHPLEASRFGGACAQAGWAACLSHERASNRMRSLVESNYGKQSLVGVSNMCSVVCAPPAGACRPAGTRTGRRTAAAPPAARPACSVCWTPAAQRSGRSGSGRPRARRGCGTQGTTPQRTCSSTVHKAQGAVQESQQLGLN